MKTIIEKIIDDAANGDENINHFMDQFNKGFKAEFEHIDTVNNNMVTVGKIVLDHLEEDPNYYTKLQSAKL